MPGTRAACSRADLLHGASRSEQSPEIAQSRLETFLERRHRPPSQQRACLADVWLPLLRVIARQRAKHDFRAAAGKPEHLLRQLQTVHSTGLPTLIGPVTSAGESTRAAQALRDDRHAHLESRSRLRAIALQTSGRVEIEVRLLAGCGREQLFDGPLVCPRNEMPRMTLLTGNRAPSPGNRV